MQVTKRLHGITGRLLLGFGVAIAVLLIQASIGAYYDHAYLEKRQEANELWRLVHGLEVMGLTVDRVVRPAHHVTKTWQATAAQEVFSAEYALLQGDIRQLIDGMAQRRFAMQQLASRVEEGAAQLNVSMQRFLFLAGDVEKRLNGHTEAIPAADMTKARALLTEVNDAQRVLQVQIGVLREALQHEVTSLHRIMEMGIHQPIWITFSVAALIATLLALLASSIIRAIRGRVETLTQMLDKQLYHDVARLQELSEKKSSFVSYVAHELKSPLSVIRGSMGNMMGGVYGPVNEAQQRAIQMVQQTVDRLVRMIRDLLDLSRIEVGKLPLKAEEVDFGALVRQVADHYAEECAEKRLAFEQTIPSETIAVAGDRDRLAQVVINLVTNAIQYTPDHGHIALRVEQADGTVRLAVEDSGMGIHENDLERIFHSYEQVDPGERSGHGLGLPIAREIVKLHGGKIWAESQWGKGTRMLVELPLGTVQ
ncbi:MAG: hypothetical protein HYV02_00755 [Deltaproteobacteria bacterium]|nr:hypothetical protein [Deltaproteobacteria bacterium]